MGLMYASLPAWVSLYMPVRISERSLIFLLVDEDIITP